jgi:phage terminase small subunit
MGKPQHLQHVRKFASPRHRVFVDAYLRHLCGTKAAIEAGYSPHSASQVAWKLMQRPEIRQAIGDAQARRLTDGELSASRVLEELRRVAFGDVRALYDQRGKLKPPSEWTPEQAAMVSLVESSSTGAVVKVRLWDRTKALELLSKHFGLLVDKTEISGGITISWLPAEANGEVVQAEDVKRLPPSNDPA